MVCRESRPAVLSARVLENRRVAPGCYRMRIENEHVAHHALPGQFVHVRVSGPSLDPLLRRPFSVCLAEPEGGEFLILYQVVGTGTRLLSALGPGDALDVLGPLGTGFEMPRPSAGREGHGDSAAALYEGDGDSGGGTAAPTRPRARRVALVAGGLGIAPLVMLGHALRRAGHGFVFIVGARSGEVLAGLLDLVPAPSCEGLAPPGSSPRREPPGLEAAVLSAGATVGGRDRGPHDAGLTCDVRVVTEDGTMGRRGLATDVLRDVLAAGGITRVYASGPAGMLREVARLCEASGVPAQVSLEERMACGLGACLGCAVRAKGEAGSRSPSYLRVCADGPVFWVKEVDLDAPG